MSLQDQLSLLSRQPEARGHVAQRIPSLLFSKKVAQSQDIHQVFEIGVNGFLELVKLENRLESFSDSLFSTQSKSTDRQLLTAEENQQLNVRVSHFLTLASPYFLLRCTQKALEYLLRRFHINQHSQVDLVGFSLPFHDTPEFIKLLSTLKLDDSLFQVFGSHVQSLSRRDLVSICLKQPTILDFICNQAKCSVDQSVLNRALTSFYTMIGINCFRMARSQNVEALVRTLSPYLLHGIQSKQRNYRAGTMMILGQMCSTTPLLDKFVSAVTPLLLPKDYGDQEALLSLCLVTQSQRIEKLPVSLVLVFLRDVRMMNAIAQVGQHVDVSNLCGLILGGYVLQCVDDDSFFAMWEEIRSALPLTTDLLASFVTDLLLKFSEKEISPKLGVLLKQIDARDADAFGDGVCQALQSDEHQVGPLIDAVFGGSSRHSLIDQQLPLFRALTHVTPTVRSHAFEKLNTSMIAGENGLADFARKSVTEGLFDTSPIVVETVLRLPWLTRVVGAGAMIPLLRRLLSDPCSQTAFSLSLQLLFSDEITMCPSVDASPLIFAHLARVGIDQRLELNQEMINSLPSRSEHPMLSLLIKIRGQSMPWVTVIQELQAYVSQRVESWSVLVENGHPMLSLLIGCSLGCSGDDEKTSYVLNSLKEHPKCSKELNWSWDSPVVGPSLTSFVYQSLIHGCATRPHVIKNIFIALAQRQADGLELIKLLLLEVYKEKPQILRFCISVWEDAAVPVDGQVRALNIATALIRMGPQGFSAAELLMTLLRPLFSPLDNVRKSASQCCHPMKKFKNDKSTDNAFLKRLVVVLAARKKELEASAANVPHIVNDTFKDLVNDKARVATLKWCAGLINHDQEPILLKSFAHVDHASRGKHFVKHLRKCIETAPISRNVALFNLLVSQYSLKQTSGGLVSDMTQFDLFLKCLSIDAVQHVALRCITLNLWERMSTKQQAAIFSTLCNLLLSGDGTIKTAVHGVAAILPVGPDAIQDHLAMVEPGTKRKKKRQKQEEPEGSPQSIARLAAALELLRSGDHHWDQNSKLVPHMFNLLDHLLHLLERNQNSLSALESVVQTTLSFLASSLSRCMVDRRSSMGGEDTKRRRKEVDSGIFLKENINTLVRCLKTCKTANTRADVLVLLHSIAEFNSKVILENLSSIVSFMGTSGVFSDDKLSLWTLRRFLSEILPLVAKTQAMELINILCSSFDIIPAHRRLNLFATLLTCTPKAMTGSVFGALLENEERQMFCLELCGVIGCEQTVVVLNNLFDTTEGRNLAFIAELLSNSVFLEPLLTVPQETAERIQEGLSSLFSKLLNLPLANATEDFYDVIESLNELFSIPLFLDCLASVILHEDEHVRHRALRIFNEKTSAHRAYLNQEEIERFLSFCEPLCDSALDRTRDERLRETALLSVEVLVRNFGASRPSGVLLAALPRIVTCLAAELDQPTSDKNYISNAAMVCLGTMSATLGPSVMVHVKSVVQILLRVLNIDDMALQFGAICALVAVVHGQSSFISPYVENILESILRPHLVQHDNFAERAAMITNEICTRIPARVLLPIIIGLFRRAMNGAANGDLTHLLTATSLAQLMSPMIAGFKSADVEAHAASVGSFLIEALNARSTLADANEKQLSLLETKTIAAFGELVLHFTEAEFRTLFSQFTHWALPDDQQCSAARLIPFFTCVSHLLGKLRSILVNIGFGYIVDYIPKILAAHQSEQISALLLDRLTNCLRLFFYYNTDRSIEASRYGALLDPLMALLSLAKEDSLRAPVRKQVVPCLVEMAISMGSHVLWRPFNAALLFATREEDAEVRLACLATLAGCHSKLSGDWQTFIPETVPFLAEMLEDDDARVEAETQNLLRTINPST